MQLSFTTSLQRIQAPVLDTITQLLCCGGAFVLEAKPVLVWSILARCSSTPSELLGLVGFNQLSVGDAARARKARISGSSACTPDASIARQLLLETAGGPGEGGSGWEQLYLITSHKYSSAVIPALTDVKAASPQQTHPVQGSLAVLLCNF